MQNGFNSAEESAALLAVLGNAKRLLIMHHLLAGELAVNELARRVNLSQSAISQHLARLRQAGLVETRRDRQTIFYSSQSDITRRLMHALDGHFHPEQPALQPKEIRPDGGGAQSR